MHSMGEAEMALAKLSGDLQRIIFSHLSNKAKPIAGAQNGKRGLDDDPAVAGAFHDVYEANLQLLHGACVLRRIEQLKAHVGVRNAVGAAALAPYRPAPLL